MKSEIVKDSRRVDRPVGNGSGERGSRRFRSRGEGARGAVAGVPSLASSAFPGFG